MQLLRRFLVIQALLLWQGGFLFYAAVVIPIGSDVLGSSWAQGTVTRHVTDRMNVIGAVALLILAWDQCANVAASCRKCRWSLWVVMALSLGALALLHPAIASYVDGIGSQSAWDYGTFYFWHRVYMYVSTAQWIAGLGYVAVTLRAWTVRPSTAS